MQFTELSELNHVIGMMRMSSCNSPTFHDRQDSEVDRIYNSSPKMEMQLRNSWIDRLAAMKVPPPAKKPISSPTSAKGGGNTAFANGGAAKDGAAAEAKNGKTSNGSAAPSKQSERDGKDAKNTEAAKEAEKAKEKESDGLEFVREEIEPITQHESSLLDKLLKGSGAPMSQKQVMMGTEGAVLHLTIYLPTRHEMKIDLYDVSTVDESIQEILRTHHAEGRQPALYYGHPECYELRLHDSDGYPDEDFPALDRSRKIKNFGDAGGHEYCLCERPDACPPTGDGASDAANAATLAKAEAVAAAAAKAAPAANEKIFLKIYLPKSDDYTVVAVDSNTTGQDLLPTLNKKHRLQLFQDQYVLKISDADRERLDLASDEIDMYTKLHPLNIHEATLSTKQYADAPQVPVTVTHTVDDAANVDSRSRPPPETFMFNDVTAAMFKEWHVIKKNKYGKRQHRMLGIDLNKIYNRKVGDRVIKSRNTTRIAERPMSSIEWVRFMQDPSEFQIYFKDSIEEIITDYTADSPYECAEIVAKLKYILSRRNQ
ncbi:hypothetical protein Poli38472_002565 [Pythium oligandrum]|uniref:SAPK-interacting protein 1 Pleckstrin-homology domain-containing protein n=1 Tax=Pythium oligandrum TaxID=41045 RepID=A0A8K1CHE9_PYTOL|nr:hypothetical protein Poli38472_002565 [Pythium oligandrum]|eukprot:TMW63624.1 hypothetical protein Poli38472_002565 [Pythium oligandrum]